MNYLKMRTHWRDERRPSISRDKGDEDVSAIKAKWLLSWHRWWREEESLFFYVGKSKSDIELRLKIAFEAGFARGQYDGRRSKKP